MSRRRHRVFGNIETRGVGGEEKRNQSRDRGVAAVFWQLLRDIADWNKGAVPLSGEIENKGKRGKLLEIPKQRRAFLPSLQNQPSAHTLDFLAKLHSNKSPGPTRSVGYRPLRAAGASI